ncbi:MAG: VOC family protein [Christensenellales bacterium]|jgi:predicted enzyme related to lactoylglutathione lyase
MAKLNLTSNITFLYFNDFSGAKEFFEKTLELPVAYDAGWACVYRLTDKSFLGAVDKPSGSISSNSKNNVLISLTVNNIHEAYEALKNAAGIENLSPVKQVKDIPLKSFFFTGPEGCQFEVEQFTSEALKKIF